MNGADLLCDTLIAGGIDTCFANPGTSEMHFVAALDRKPRLRCVLGLFEGVVTGAADGYGRMTGRPAATLLHTGPGLANGLANLHNAQRANTPVVNIVGDHASYHLAFDAPLTTDIEAISAPMASWTRRIERPDDIGRDAALARDAALEGPGVATLILPADAAWSEVRATSVQPKSYVRSRVPDAQIRAVAAALRAAPGRCGLVIGGQAARTGMLETAARIAAATGARLFGDMFMPRAERGAGRVPLTRIPYPVDDAVRCLAGCDVLVLVGTAPPVAFFAYPGKPSRLAGEAARVLVLAEPREDCGQALDDLAERLKAPRHRAAAPEGKRHGERPSGTLTDLAISQVLALRLPEGAIVVDEALTSARSFYGLSEAAAPHDYLMACTGGAIGAGLPVATGAAVACPDRTVLALQADGSGMYTLQALWTQAREKLDVVTILFANRAYAILQHEMRAVGVTRFGRNAERMLSLDHPPLDWVSLAVGMGVEGRRVETVEAFDTVLTDALSRRGPFLVEAVL